MMSTHAVTRLVPATRYIALTALASNTVSSFWTLVMRSALPDHDALAQLQRY
jgi:hypothetical protein